MTYESENDVIPDSSTGETNDAGDGETTPLDTDAVPYARFKEVNDELKAARADITSLKEAVASIKPKEQEEEYQDPATWKEAEERFLSKAILKVKEEFNREQMQELKIEQGLEKTFDHLSALGHTITPEIRKGVYERMIKTGSDDVIATFAQYTQEQTKQQKGQQQRSEGFVPPSYKSSSVNVPSFSYKDIHGKDPMDMAMNAKK